MFTFELKPSEELIKQIVEWFDQFLADHRTDQNNELADLEYRLGVAVKDNECLRERLETYELTNVALAAAHSEIVDQIEDRTKFEERIDDLRERCDSLIALSAKLEHHNTTLIVERDGLQEALEAERDKRIIANDKIAHDGALIGDLLARAQKWYDKPHQLFNAVRLIAVACSDAIAAEQMEVAYQQQPYLRIRDLENALAAVINHVKCSEADCLATFRHPYDESVIDEARGVLSAEMPHLGTRINDELRDTVNQLVKERDDGRAALLKIASMLDMEDPDSECAIGALSGSVVWQLEGFLWKRNQQQASLAAIRNTLGVLEDEDICVAAGDLDGENRALLATIVAQATHLEELRVKAVETEKRVEELGVKVVEAGALCQEASARIEEKDRLIENVLNERDDAIAFSHSQDKALSDALSRVCSLEKVLGDKVLDALAPSVRLTAEQARALLHQEELRTGSLLEPQLNLRYAAVQAIISASSGWKP